MNMNIAPGRRDRSVSLYVVHMERQAPSPDRALDRAAAGGCRATPGGWPADGRRRRRRRRRRRQRRRRRRQRRRLALDGINDGSLYQCNVSMPLCLVYAAPGTVAGVESRGGGGGSTGTGRCESHSRAHDWSGSAPRGGCDVRRQRRRVGQAGPLPRSWPERAEGTGSPHTTRPATGRDRANKRYRTSPTRELRQAG
jgi:hypothetical protein